MSFGKFLKNQTYLFFLVIGLDPVDIYIGSKLRARLALVFF